MGKEAAVEQHLIVLGDEYAIREPVAVGVEFQRVVILEHVRKGRWKARWINPNPGMVDYITSKNVIVEWKQRAAFLSEERCVTRFARHLTSCGYPGNGHPLSEAVHQVIEAMGEPTVSFSSGDLDCDPEALTRLVTRAGVKRPDHPISYVDRGGRLHIPYDAALRLAEDLARAEPMTVLVAIDALEREWTIEAREPGGRGIADLLASYRPSWALIRQWAGHDKAVKFRDDRIEQLERLLVRTMWDLRMPNPDPMKVAGRIERQLR